MKNIIAIALLGVLCGCGTPDMSDPLPHSIHVEGAVARPGEYVLPQDARLTYGIAAAGGYTDRVSEICIIRDGKVMFRIDGKTFRLARPHQDPILKNGDTIQVAR
ncbi:MAG: SLBB domain-containing protein [Lentisphaerae bacterium]|nr:SLBB domain-containing protein [Lentisphaerota bacterium]